MDWMREDSMMTTALLGSLLEAGVRFEVHGERLKYHAPKGVMKPELVKRLTEARLELISLLREHTGESQKMPRIVAVRGPPCAIGLFHFPSSGSGF